MSLELLPAIAFGSLACLTAYIIKFYWTVKQLPVGPFPLPFIGNILSFRTDDFVHDILFRWSKRFRPVFTMYLGPKPIIVIGDATLGMEEFRKAAFAGRPDYGVATTFFKDGSTDIFFGDWSREWEVLRRVGHEAVRKYQRSSRHPLVVASVIDQLVADVKRGKEFETYDCLSLVMNAILANAAFGKEYRFDDDDFIAWKKSIDRQAVGSGKLMLLVFVPFFRHIPGYKQFWEKFQKAKEFQEQFLESRFNECQEKFDGDNESVSNFCEALIAAENESSEEDRKYLRRQNIMNSVGDLFFAGSDTTRSTLCWIFLFLCKNPEMQERIREEILSAIPDDEIPLAEHRDNCPFTQAFISEVMRFRHIFPNSAPHKTTTDVLIAGCKIPKGTIVLFPLFSCLMNDSADGWKDPHVFNPERFLVDGKFVNKPNPYAIPFGVGRRSCPGNNLALLTMFLVISRLVQHTKNKWFNVLGGNKSIGITGQKIGAMWIADKYVISFDDEPID